MKAKRILSLLVAVAMLVGVLSIGAVSASADELHWETLYDWEEHDSHLGIVSTVGNTSVYRDASNVWLEGSTVRLQVTGGYYNQFENGKCPHYVAIDVAGKLDETVQDVRVAIEYAGNGAGTPVFGVVYKGETYFTAHGYGVSLGKSWLSFNGHTLYSYFADAAQPTLQLGPGDWKDVSALLFGAYDTYNIHTIDDVQVGHKTSLATFDVPAPTSRWETVYDWETDDQFANVGAVGVGVSIDTAFPASGSTRHLNCTGGNYNQPTYENCYISVGMKSAVLEDAVQLRAFYRGTQNSQTPYYGVTVDGVNYWKNIWSDGVWVTANFIGETFYSTPGDESTALTITSENVTSVTNLLFTYYDSYNWKGLDDIQVKYVDTNDDYSSVNGIAADKEGNLTLPEEPSVSGEQFIGWMDPDGNLYKAGETVKIAADTQFTAVTSILELQTGAGIRWAETEKERGIRFETYVSKDAFDALGSSKFTLGTLILPYADYSEDLTVENAAAKGAVNVVNTSIYGTAVNGQAYRYYAGVVDFEKYFGVSQSALADLKLTAVSYTTITYHDGSTQTFYCRPNATKNVRSVAQVARAALADTAFGYTEDQIAILNLYTQYSEETNTPKYRKDAADKI